MNTSITTSIEVVRSRLWVCESSHSSVWTCLRYSCTHWVFCLCRSVRLGTPSSFSFHPTALRSSVPWTPPVGRKKTKQKNMQPETKTMSLHHLLCDLTVLILTSPYFFPPFFLLLFLKMTSQPDQCKSARLFAPLCGVFLFSLPLFCCSMCESVLPLFFNDRQSR